MYYTHPGKGSSELASSSGSKFNLSPISAAFWESASNHVAATPTMFAHHSMTGSQQPVRKNIYLLEASLNPTNSTLCKGNLVSRYSVSLFFPIWRDNWESNSQTSISDAALLSHDSLECIFIYMKVKWIEYSLMHIKYTTKVKQKVINTLMFFLIQE